jgi:hypothetical protein
MLNTACLSSERNVGRKYFFLGKVYQKTKTILDWKQILGKNKPIKLIMSGHVREDEKM